MVRASEPSKVQAFDLVVPYAPSAARIGGSERLVYELHLTNFARVPLEVIRIDIVDAANGLTIGSMDASGAMVVLGSPSITQRIVAPGQRAVAYIDTAAVPPGSSILHRVVFTGASRAGSEPYEVEGGLVTVAKPFPAVIAAPLRGGPWAAVALPELVNGHRRTTYAVAGQVRIPGRHAVDWMPAKGFRKSSAGVGVGDDGAGAEVLAVAPAIVAAVKEPPPPGAPASIEDETGAMVVLRLNDGRYAFYEHLQPGIPVHVGQRLRTGDTVGRLGSSGHVTQPHLHFHIADGPRPLASEGLPYRLMSGSVIGSYDDASTFSAGGAWLKRVPSPVDGVPPPMSVVMFRDAPR